MGQALSLNDAYATPSREFRQARGKARRGKRQPALVPVPVLDWPSNLFSDNVSKAALVAEEFPAPLSLAEQDPGRYFLAAA